jgi:hypothetical protein
MFESFPAITLRQDLLMPLKKNGRKDYCIQNSVQQEEKAAFWL